MLPFDKCQQSFRLRLSPQGVVGARPYAGDEGWARSVVKRFEEDESAGLVALGAANLSGNVDASLLFWYELAACFLRALCHLPEDEHFSVESVEPPSTATLAEWVLNAPPMQGGEYIDPAVLNDVWRRLTEWSVAQVHDCEGLGDFLHSYAPRWSLIGRVTLHLAENKGDDEYPFAFMATYASGLSRSGRVRRLPLGQALREYAGTGRKKELLKLLSPLHAAAKRSELIADLVETGDVFHPLVWTPREAYAFLKEIPLYEECGLTSQLPNWWRKRSRPQVAVALDAKKGSQVGREALLDFSISMVLGDQDLSPQEVEAILNEKQGLMIIRGEWVEVDSEKLREALEHWREVEQSVGSSGLSFIEGMRLLAGAGKDLKGAGAEDEEKSWGLVEAGDSLRAVLAGLRTPTGLGGSVPTGFRGHLRDYQLNGLNWLWLCSQLGLGACLADDMGLGKTIQVLAALLRHREVNAAAASRPSLLIVPASLIGNWREEADRFAPELNLLTLHGSELSEDQMDELARDPLQNLQGVDLAITTYGMISRLEWLTCVDWAWVIADEAQAIKNPSTKQTKSVKRIKSAARVALTGTPVENRLGDLWSIFDFLNPGLLGSASRFKTFAKSLRSGEHTHYAPLRKLVSPYILRRMKTDPNIISDLPEKTEMRVFCGLSKAQAVLYKQNVNALESALDNPDVSGIQRRGLVLSYLMRFKQICNHPSQLTGDGSYDHKASAKFDRLKLLCDEIAARGEKALVFTQFREIAPVLAELMATVFGRDGSILHGGTPVKKRRQLVAEFQSENGPPFFVLSIKAAGTGLNLTAASHVVHFDRWWNPAVENQATDRAFRIGQKKNVLVHKFVTRGTIEEKIDALIREKQQMADALLDDGTEKSLTEMSDEEILDMVRLDIERARV